MTEGALVSLLTLGCKLNLADSRAMSDLLTDAGYRVAEHLCEADAVVINTCTVTATADQKSRKLVRAARRLSPAATVAVTGCYPQSAGKDHVRSLGADFVAGTGRHAGERVVAYLGSRLAGGQRRPGKPPAIAGGSRRGRAFIEAQTGCTDVCAFCIIPRTRGRERSRTITAICRDVDQAANAGAQEAVITGTQLGAWGRDLDGAENGPARLISALLDGTHIPRLRLSSLQPRDITPELLALWSDPRLMPHFHLALQSGSDHILETMRRRYTARDFVLAAERIYLAVPDAALTTDVIAGFPGEMPADFDATVRLCLEVRFARIHAFPFSTRPGTLAASLPGHIPGSTKRERMAQLLAVGAALSADYEARFVGTTRPVLWEDPGTGRNSRPATYHQGYTDNYIRVRAVGTSLCNRITQTRLTARRDGFLAGEPLLS